MFKKVTLLLSVFLFISTIANAMLCGCMNRIVLPQSQTVILVMYSYETETHCNDPENASAGVLNLMNESGEVLEVTVTPESAVNACN